MNQGTAWRCTNTRTIHYSIHRLYIMHINYTIHYAHTAELVILIFVPCVEAAFAEDACFCLS